MVAPSWVATFRTADLRPNDTVLHIILISGTLPIPSQIISGLKSHYSVPENQISFSSFVHFLSVSQTLDDFSARQTWGWGYMSRGLG